MSELPQHITAKLKRELVLRIDPDKRYYVSYQWHSKEGRIEKPTYLLGSDLTENQIIELYQNGEI
jgi:hypothetical protein